MKYLHLIRKSTLPNRGPHPSLNHNKTLADMPTYIVLNVLSVGSFFSLMCILKAKSEAKGITRNLNPTIRDITDFIVRGPFLGETIYFIAPRTSFFQWDCLKCIT